MINRSTVADIRKYNKDRTEQALKNDGSLKVVKRKLGIGKNQTYALRDKQCKVTINMDKMVKLAEEVYRYLYSRRATRMIMDEGYIHIN